MRKNLFSYIIVGIIFVGILGSLWHFIYEWSGNNPLVALIAPVNESTWEHLKLLFFPMLLYIPFLQSRFPENTSIICSMLLATFTGILLIPTLFYTYSGILGTNYAIIDISIFFISEILAFLLAYHLIQQKISKKYQSLLIICACIMTALFFYFTFHAPDLGIFWVP